MKFLATLLCVLFYHAGLAQIFAGVTTGASYWESIGAIESFTPLQQRQPVSWEKGISLRYEAQKWFAVEVSIMHFSMSHTNAYPSLYSYPVRSRDVRDQFLDYSASFQSRLTYKQRKFRHYIGWTFNYGSHRVNPADQKGESKMFNYGGVGLTHFLRCPLVKRIHVGLRSTFSIISTPSMFVADVVPRFQSLLSLSYQF